MDTNNTLQTKTVELTNKINILIELKNKVSSLKLQNEKSKEAINLALENTQLFKNFFKDIGGKLQNVNIAEVNMLLQKVEENEAQLNGFFQLANAEP